MQVRHTLYVWGGIVALMTLLSLRSVAQDVPTLVSSDVALAQRLHDTLVDIDYDGMDLDDVFDHLRQTHDLNIHVAWRMLDLEGVRKDERVELSLRGVTLDTVFQLILRDVTRDFITRLGYSVRNGVIVVSNREDLNRDTVLETYNVADLIDSGYSIRRFANTPVLGLALTGREFIGGEERETPVAGGGGGGGGGGSGGGIFGEPDEEADRITQHELLDQIVNLIQEYIDPEDWRDLGGETGSITTHGSALLIQHSIDGHRKVKSFLKLLRAGKPTSLDVEAVVVHLRADRAHRWRGMIGGSYPRITDEHIAKLTYGEDAGDVIFRATSTGHNGEKVWFSALTQRDVLAGLTPSISDHDTAFDPVTAVATEGLELIALPLLDAEGRQLSLDVQMAWVPPSAIDQRSVSLNGDDQSGSIDRVSRTMRTVSTRVTLDVGQAIALTIPQAISDHGRSSEFEDWLIIRVKRSN